MTAPPPASPPAPAETPAPVSASTTAPGSASVTAPATASGSASLVASVIAPGLVIAAIALPWLTLAPLHGVAAVLAHTLTLIAAFHGAGLVVARLAGQRSAPPLLVIQWGIAALIGASGLAIACQIGTLAAQAALVFGCAAIHTAVLGIRFADHVERATAALDGPRAWLVPAAVLAGFGALTVLGAAGDRFAQPFDGDGHLLAQLHRVLDTGALADPVGYPRNAGLGAQVALAAVLAGPGDGFTHAGDALAAVLALGLAVSCMAPREPVPALWGALLAVAAFALAFAPFDPLPCWTAVGLIVAVHHMLGDDAPPPALPLAITAGALAAVRYELAPIAAVAVIAAWWRAPRDHRRTAILLGGVFAVMFPFAVSRALAWRSAAAAHALVAHTARSALAVRAALTGAIALPGALVLRLALPDDRALRAAAITSAVAIAAIAAQLTGAGPASWRLAWPIAIGFAVTLVIGLARSRWSGPAALIAALALCVAIAGGGNASGHLRWSRRMAAAAAGIEALAAPPAVPRNPYAPLVARIPAGATLAVWIAEPERLDYTHRRIFDLRTPTGARFRDHRFNDHPSLVAALLTQLSADYLLVEADDDHVLRTQSEPLYRQACREPRPAACDDDLEAVARSHRVVAEHAGVRLIDLRR